MSVQQQIQNISDATPSWLNWVVIAGSAAASWIQPVAGIVAIVWGCLQIYGWFANKKWKQ